MGCIFTCYESILPQLLRPGPETPGGGYFNLIGTVLVFVTLGSLILCFSNYGKGTEKVRKWGRVRVRKKYQKFKCGYGNGYGKLSNMGTEKREGYGLF